MECKFCPYSNNKSQSYLSIKLAAWTAYSWQETKISKAGKYAANSYAYVIGIDYQLTPALRSSVWTTGQGSFYVEQTNRKGRSVNIP